MQVVTHAEPIAPQATFDSATLPPTCRHCGSPCLGDLSPAPEPAFCCAGCRTVYHLLHAGGLARFYELDPAPGLRPPDPPADHALDLLDADPVRRQLLDFSDGRLARATFRIPAIHCAACVWLLENLFRLNPAIGEARVHFPRRTLSLAFEETRLRLSDVVRLLTSLGYPPTLTLGSAAAPPPDPEARRLLIRLGVAGFAFGNIMLMSLCAYLGLRPARDGVLAALLGGLSLALAVPVFVYSAAGYWQAAWRCIRQRRLTIEFPIALGLVALFVHSAAGIVTGRSEGYLDSFAGLVFLLLCGQWFQRRTFASLAFDHDYKSYFPLAATRREGPAATRAVPVAELAVGDRILVRHGELIPADARLCGGDACIDYSFVTGESAPQPRRIGAHVFAGGRQVGRLIELEIVKPVSQSYLTSLWNQAAFRKPRTSRLQTVTDRAGRAFTYAVMVVAAVTLAAWLAIEPARALHAFTSILLVACPCALALTAPFALGNAQRLLGRNRLYLRHSSVVEDLSRIDTVIFDKTGTLTHAGFGGVAFDGAPLAPDERAWVAALAAQSAHPASRQIATALAAPADSLAPTRFTETPGHGIQGTVAGHAIRLGTPEFCAAQASPTEFSNAPSPTSPAATGPVLAIDGVARGRFLLHAAPRDGLPALLARLAARYRLALLSGDSPATESLWRRLFGPAATLCFGQSPHAKLAFIAQHQQAAPGGVLMLGDGLNDAGALKQSQVGIAVSEDVSLFAPACDGILDARRLPRLADFLAYARSAVGIVRLGFGISLLYNAVGIGIAATGRLSPLVAAVLMPISSFSVIGFALLATRLSARRHGLES